MVCTQRLWHDGTAFGLFVYRMDLCIPSMEILGEAAAGKSTGDAMKFMADLVAKLPAGVGYSWTGLSYQEALSSNQAPALYAISLVVVFLALAALYESWSIPFSVMLVVPIYAA